MLAIFPVVLILATILCSLVAGFLFAFAVVVMPGIGKLKDDSFIRAFQVIDRVIQDNQPMFMLVWVGSVLAVVAAAALGSWALAGTDRLLVIAATLIYLLFVQAPTAAINIPLNNQLHKIDPDAMDEPTRKRARNVFEARWNRWNAIRTAAATVTSTLLMLVLLRL